ncbi:hypothetical protein [Bacillus subtilis]|uniref:ATP-dependent DNA ligase n=1 Tax=Bacillus subtilis TaxID=1423 RepID=UPI0025CA4F51|nr:hypothetical protein [Bacillus subtilis]WCS68071.1 DNA ligase [Bacillus phage vB_BsuM-Goe26]GLI90884.1 hypothetical protein ANABIO4_42360 [Bacillus subtilis]
MSKLLNVIKIIAELEGTSKRNEKQAILEAAKGDGMLKEVFYYAYNPFLRYHMKKFEVPPVKEKDVQVKDENFEKFKSILNELHNRTFTGSEAHSVVQTFFEKLTAVEVKLFSRILRQDLDVGVTAKTFNKTFPNAIPTFECMLAQDSAKVKLQKLGYEMVIIEPKLDGYRCIGEVHETGEVKMLTRNGKPIKGYNLIEAELAKLPVGVYDGEITGVDNTFSGVQSQAFKHATGKKGIYNIFDYVPLGTFDKGRCDIPILERKKLLEENFESVETTPVSLRLCTYSKVMNIFSEEIDDTYDKFLGQGYEGLMIKDANSAYVCGRPNSWLKKVPFISLDLKVVGFEKGDENGKYRDTLGALVVEYNGNTVNVSGIKDSLRDEIWKNQDKYLGAIAEIHAREPSKNKHDENSLRFPRFKRWREDKE